MTEELLPDIPKITDEIVREGKQNVTIVDVGGGSGQMSKAFYENLPTLRCINFDTPSVIKKHADILGIEMVGGDFFKVETLPECDIIFTKYIFHDWPESHCIKMLKNFHQVLAADGLLLSVNYDLPEPGETQEACHIASKDLTMAMLFGRGSAERTITEYKRLHQKAEFTVMRTIDIGVVERPYKLIIAKKI